MRPTLDRDTRSCAWARYGRLFVLCAMLFPLLMTAGCKHAVAQRAARPAGHATPSIWPVSDPNIALTSRFGELRPPARTHKGIDLSVPLGTPVHAAADGVVTFSGVQGAYGELVTIGHAPNLETAYGHLQKRLVQASQSVRQGDVIGQVGKTGNASGVHLHYEVRRNGQCVDPALYLPRRQLRTLDSGDIVMGAR